MVGDGRSIALVTNATDFAGRPAVDALAEAGIQVFAHDPGFADQAVWDAYRAGRERIEPVDAEEPEAVVAAVVEKAGALDCVVSNDHHPAPSTALESADVAELRANYEKLVAFPFGVVQAALPALRRRGGGNVVMVTSNRTRLPLEGAAFPDAARAAANAMVRSLAIDCARDGIVVNAVAPNFLYSEAYYPKAVFRDTPAGQAYIKANVPVGRLADPSEIGEVILFLATVRTRFLTGSIIDFSGGWPFSGARPSG